jgi:hypothetical protein
VNSVYKLLIQIIGKDVGASRELKETKREVDGLTTSANKMGKAMQGLAGLGMVYMARQAASAAWDLAQLGAESLRMTASFDDLAQRINTTGDALLGALTTAARGTVTEMDLMRTTAGLLASGLQTSTTDIVDAMEIAQLKAQQFGITTTEAYDRMVTGARKFSVEMLDEIGINLKAESVYKRRAEALGTVASALTDAQRAEALWLAILEDGRAELEQYGGATDDLLTDMQRTQVAVDDMKIAFAEELAPAVVEVTNALTDLIPVISDIATGPVASLLVDFAGDLTQMANSVKLFVAAGQGEISLFDAVAADAEAARIKTEEGTEAMTAYVDALLTEEVALKKIKEAQDEIAGAKWLLDQAIEFHQTEEVIEDYRYELRKLQAQYDAMPEVIDAATEAGKGWMISVSQLPGYLSQANTALTGHLAVIQQIGKTYLALQNLPQDVFDLAPGAEDEWLAIIEMRDAAEQEWLDKARERLHGFGTANEETARSVGKTWQDTYDEIRSAVESALTPTTVTGLDMSLSELGLYVDKWDENARRLDAVAEAGFAAFDAHPDWVEILKIPDNVLAAGEEGLKSWAAQTAASVRDLTRPDLLNVDAAVAAVEQYFADMAARELSIDIVTQAMIDKGVVTGPDAKKMVAQALGLDQTGIGETAGAEIFSGMVDKFKEKSATAEFATYLKADIANHPGDLKDGGYQLWLATEVGIIQAMEEGNYVMRWVELLLPFLTAALGSQGQWSGEGEP